MTPPLAGPRTFSERLLVALRAHGLRKIDVANLTAIPSTRISRYCAGQTEPRAANVAALLRALPQTDARWLLTGEGA
jgi:transcriptional regulator with XRE-family HTH domain